MADIFLTLIITSASADLARQIAASFGPGGEGMWTTPLSETDTTTHYVSSGYIPEQFAYMVPCKYYQYTEDGWTVTSEDAGNAEAVFQPCINSGIDCTLEDIQAIFATSDVTDQEPFVAFDRLNLKIVQTPLE